LTDGLIMVLQPAVEKSNVVIGIYVDYDGLHLKYRALCCLCLQLVSVFLTMGLAVNERYEDTDR